jgi:hypothetical protein
MKQKGNKVAYESGEKDFREEWFHLKRNISHIIILERMEWMIWI